ncbi:MAG: hypothetical protein NC355_05075 [Blautia sp.]|nr:hypothetical protein [Blautia sp.]
MNWMNKLEKKLWRYAVPNLCNYFVAAIVIGMFGNLILPDLINFLSFSPYYILHGQIWRLVTWVFVPVVSFNFLDILFLLFTILWGKSLETFLGTFRMNVFLIQGILLSDLGGLLIYGLSWAVLGEGLSIYLTTYYILLSVTLAVAICMPEGEVRIYFVLPLKMKWMLLFELLYLGYTVYSFFEFGQTISPGVEGIMYGLYFSAQIVLAIGSMFLFFWFAKVRPDWKHKKRQREFQAQFTSPRPGAEITRHKCAVCGRTEKDAPNMAFRYCSKCNGNVEYCEEHLFSHRHLL